MKTLDQGPDKIKKICKALREETLEPAEKEAQDIIKTAHKHAEQILSEARQAAERLRDEARADIEKEQNAFQSSLEQAAKQCIETLKQSVETKFFNQNLLAIIEKSNADSKLVAKLINAIISALEKEGLAANLTALVPKQISEHDVNQYLLKEAISALKEKSVVLGDFGAGVKVRLNNKQLTIDISEEALKELLGNHLVRKDFRKIVFAS